MIASLLSVGSWGSAALAAGLATAPAPQTPTEAATQTPSSAEPVPAEASPAPAPAAAPASESASADKRPPRAKPQPIKRSADTLGERPDEDETNVSTRLSAHGEWYLPDAYDASLRDKTRDAWTGKYNGLSMQYEAHRFITGGLAGQTGSALVARFDFSDAFALNVGSYFPNRAFMFGFTLFGNQRIRIAESQRADIAVGVVLPEVSVRFVTLRDPRSVVLTTGLNILGVRMVVADILELTVRGGAPGFWLTIPQLGTAASWNVTANLGVTF